ncbi:hypothetical protein JZ751_005327, partial [Albula glossodonta]
VNLEALQPESLELASHKVHELNQSLRDLEAKLGQLNVQTPPPAQGACGPAPCPAPGPAPGPAPTPCPAPLPTSFTPVLPSAVGAALELQLHGEKTKVAELSRRCQELELKAGTFENIVCVLNREVERSHTTLEANSRQHRLDLDKVRQLERTVGLKDLTIAEMEGRMREMAATTFDGIFVWRISDFTKKRQDAVAGRAPAMFSPAFYTSKYGYKMCLRIYLNGDGTGRGTHLSLFFVVMRGLSDALLKWPFNQKVTLMLLDQSNREHIIDAFRPDITSSSFQRPVSEMNIASGCPLFCPLAKLDSKNSYIRDDTIFIKAINCPPPFWLFYFPALHNSPPPGGIHQLHVQSPTHAPPSLDEVLDTRPLQYWFVPHGVTVLSEIPIRLLQEKEYAMTDDFKDKYGLSAAVAILSARGSFVLTGGFHSTRRDSRPEEHTVGYAVTEHTPALSSGYDRATLLCETSLLYGHGPTVQSAKIKELRCDEHTRPFLLGPWHGMETKTPLIQTPEERD